MNRHRHRPGISSFPGAPPQHRWWTLLTSLRCPGLPGPARHPRPLNLVVRYSQPDCATKFHRRTGNLDELGASSSAAEIIVNLRRASREQSTALQCRSSAGIGAFARHPRSRPPPGQLLRRDDHRGHQGIRGSWRDFLYSRIARGVERTTPTTRPGEPAVAGAVPVPPNQPAARAKLAARCARPPTSSRRHPEAWRQGKRPKAPIEPAKNSRTPKAKSQTNRGNFETIPSMSFSFFP